MKSLFQINTTTPLLVVLLLLMTAFTARAQGSRIQMSSLDHLAPKANETVDVNIDERLMKMAAKVFSDKDADEKEVKELVAGLKGIYVRSFEFDADGQYSAADVESIRAQLRAPDWTRLVNVTSKKEGTFEVYMLMNGEQIGGLVVLSAEDKELTVVNIVGPVDLEKLAKLEGQLGVPDLGIETTKPKTKNEKN
jgi:Domain of unknown function (DUF4252)